MTEQEKAQVKPEPRESGCAGLPAGCMVILAALAVMFVVAVVTTEPSADPTAGSPPVASTPAAPPTMPELLQQKVRVKATRYTRGPYDATKDPQHFTEASAMLGGLTGTIDVAQVWWRESGSRYALLSRATDVIELFSRTDMPDLLVLVIEAELVNVYGQTDWWPVMHVYIRQTTVAKIVWANFRPQNVPKIAEYYWEHPALKK